MPSTDQLKKWFKDHYEETLKDFFTFFLIKSFKKFTLNPVAYKNNVVAFVKNFLSFANFF